MTPPVRPEVDYTARIAEARKAGHSIEAIAGWLDQNGQGQQARELRRTQSGNLANDGGNVADGMFIGMGNRLAAGAGTVAQVVTGKGLARLGLAEPDTRPVGEIYDQLSQDAATKTGAYRDANPIRSIAGNVAGGVLAGRAIPFIRVPTIGVGTAAGRAVNAAANAGLQGGVSGAATAPEGRRIRGAVEGAVLGAGAGAVTSGVVDLAKGGYRMVRAAMQGAPPTTAVPPLPFVTPPGPPPMPAPTRVARLRGAAASGLERGRAAVGLEASDPAVPADARRVIARLRSQGRSVDDLDAAVQQSDGPDILAEAGGARMVRDLRTARTLGYNAPEEIETTLNARGMGEQGRVSDALTRETGRPVDDVAFANERLATARANSRPEYDAFRAMGPLEDERVVAALTDLNETTRALGIGRDVIGEVQALARLDSEELVDDLFDEAGQLLRVPTAQEADWIKKALDPIVFASERASAQGMNMPGTFSGARLDYLRRARANFVRAVDDATDQQYARARAEFAGPMEERTAFLGAQKAAPSISATDDPARILGDSPNPEATARGTANYIHNQLGKVTDGTGGANIQNPGNRIMGNQERTNRLLVATRNNPAAVARIERVGENAGRRLQTRQTVLQGSQTTEKVFDASEQLLSPEFLGKAIGSPLKAAGEVVSRIYAGIGRRATGREMDQMARMLMAGAEGQMTKQEAIATLRRFEPILERQWAQQARSSAGAGAAGARAVVRR